MEAHAAARLGHSPVAAALQTDMIVRLWQLALGVEQGGAGGAREHMIVQTPPRGWNDAWLPSSFALRPVRVPPGRGTPNTPPLIRGNASQPRVVCDVDENFAAYGWLAVTRELLAAAPGVRAILPVLVAPLQQWLPRAARGVTGALQSEGGRQAWAGYTAPASRVLAAASPLAAADSWDVAMGAVFELHERARLLRRAHAQLYMPVLDMGQVVYGGAQAHVWIGHALGVASPVDAPPIEQEAPPLAPEEDPSTSVFPANYTTYRIRRYVAEMRALFRARPAHALPPALLSARQLHACRRDASVAVGLQHSVWGRLPELTELEETLHPNSSTAVAACTRPSAQLGAQAAFPAAGTLRNFTAVLPSTTEDISMQQVALQDAAGAFACRWAQCVAWKLQVQFLPPLAATSAAVTSAAALGRAVGCWRFTEGDSTIPQLMQSAVDWVDTVLSLQEGEYTLDDASARRALYNAKREKGSVGGAVSTKAKQDADAANLAGSPAAADAMRRVCRAVLPSGRIAALRADQPMGGEGPGLLRSKSGAPILLEGLEGVDRMALARNVLQAAGAVALPPPGRRPPLRMPVPAMPQDGGAGVPSRRVMLDLQKMCKAAAQPLCLRSYVMHAEL